MKKVVPTIANITIYPIKSLDGISLNSAQIIEGGCLNHDREYAMTDSSGNFIIGKSNALVHSLRSTINFDRGIVSLRHQREFSWSNFNLETEKAEIQEYLSTHFGTPVSLHQNKKGRLMDIPDISGLTILSTASLQIISEWYDTMTLEETRKRFRATLEIQDAPAFWEDYLFSFEGRGIEFKIGELTLIGMSPRARCVVPSRNPTTGEVIHAFPKIFAKHRADTLPKFSKLKEYRHHYHLAINCYIPATEIGKWIHVGDKLEIIGEKVFY
ncbi:MAG: MOSC N-terminal beta barrel domain-containing protein [Saprospiraceae bacterium]